MKPCSKLVILIATVLTALPCCGDAPATNAVPTGTGQLTSQPAWFTAGKDELGHQIEYFCQAAQNGKLILTASNGFFDQGIRATGTSKLKDVANGTKDRKVNKEVTIMAFNYGQLDGWQSPKKTMRWHVWISKPGELKAVLKLKANRKNPAAVIVVTFAGQTQRAKASDAKALAQGLAFDVKTPGKHSLVVRAETAAGKEVGTLSTVTLHGPAVTKAKLLRARWRPAAVHGGYRCSKMDDTDMWVMVSKSTSPCSSYSPITTPFGYYGTSFMANQRSNGAFNFSMWSAANLTTVQQAHLLALGSPKGEFSGFGHEGTGVKPRGWIPLPSKPKEVVQCLRVERTPQHNTYYGYLLDPKTGNWKLFCVGRKATKPGTSKRARKARPLWPGSFVEVPGPPDRQRSGDLIRNVLRKGWCLDKNGAWQRMDLLPAGKTERQNKGWGVTKDGWFTFKMGGMEHFTTPKGDIRLPKKFVNEAKPPYLSPEKVNQLYKLPTTFGTISAKAASTSATVTLGLKDAGTHARATVYYGTKDCLTFAPRKKHGTERNASTLKAGGTWAAAKAAGAVKTGTNRITLTGLSPKTNYFFRVLVTNDQGKTWTFQTYSFTTK
ncbi:MAG: hypothetical protein HN909_01625 [Phycisphaerales bacterium]|jgi:hypothetical protein|nr:hypothetical protein [Phycisphaerales bacterium]MBT7170448.1 hypothetical protein [Phycisphaerales bacterium]